MATWVTQSFFDKSVATRERQLRHCVEHCQMPRKLRKDRVADELCRGTAASF
jgi:hypothetical protein